MKEIKDASYYNKSLKNIVAQIGVMQKRQEDYKRYKSTPVNLPRYRCRCIPHLDCSFCNNERHLSYSDALDVWNIDQLSLGLQVPQCHICSQFETEDNSLFAYSWLEKNGEFKFIYRCLKGHDHDHGMTLIDIHTGLEVYL
jgi:hypothetical protein